MCRFEGDHMRGRGTARVDSGDERPCAAPERPLNERTQRRLERVLDHPPELAQLLIAAHLMQRLLCGRQRVLEKDEDGIRVRE